LKFEAKSEIKGFSPINFTRHFDPLVCNWGFYANFAKVKQEYKHLVFSTSVETLWQGAIRLFHFLYAHHYVISSKFKKVMKKETKQERKKRAWREFKEEMKNTPQEKKSKICLWLEKHDEPDDGFFDMRAALK
jgi:hypothetical protein